jgi:hypothetical protein
MNLQKQHIICYSGGESSALAAIEVYRKFGNKSLILLNHDIHINSEDADIKRFKTEVAAYIGIPVTYANMHGWDKKDQFDVVVEAGAFKVRNGTALCTNRMKTQPFYDWLKANNIDQTSTVYYGFEPGETGRIQRRSTILAALGYCTGFPLLWEVRTIKSTREIGIEPPLKYSIWKHANCTGCLKAGMQHWYVVYCTRPDVWARGLWAEDEIGYTIIKGHSLYDLASKFEILRLAGVPATEKLPSSTFWKEARKLVKLYEAEHTIPCECIT